MFELVAIPAWLLGLIVLFATVAALDYVLVPSARWFLRRRMERVVARLNRRLKRPIEPFKLARRHDTIQRLIYDPKVIEAVGARAHATGEPEAVVFEEARRFAGEIVPAFSATAYFGIGTRVARWFSRSLFDVRLIQHADAQPEVIDHDATIVYVMNHRSNMDYVLVTWLIAEHSALSYAVGQWARVWPLTALIRSMGAYFIRRRERNAVYYRVLQRYVQMATAGGVTQAVFPEGGLSLDGRLARPQLGILGYMMEGFDPGGARDLVFVPVAVNYDRVIEDRILVEAAARGERRFRAKATEAVAFAARYLWNRARSRSRRFGLAAVSFGAPVSMRAWTEAGAGDTAALAACLMERIADAMPLLPVPLAAAAVLKGEPASRESLVGRALSCIEALPPGAEMVLPGGAAEAVRRGLVVLEQRGLVVERAGRLEPAGEGLALLPFYAAMATDR